MSQEEKGHWGRKLFFLFKKEWSNMWRMTEVTRLWNLYLTYLSIY